MTRMELWSLNLITFSSAGKLSKIARKRTKHWSNGLAVKKKTESGKTLSSFSSNFLMLTLRTGLSYEERVLSVNL